jgi:rhodanese-related sulfurtransferase
MQSCRPIALFVLVIGSLALAGCGSSPERDTRPAGKASAAPAWPMRLKPFEVREFIQKHPETLLIDVRDLTEWNDDVGHIDGSRRIPLSQLGGRLTEIEAWKNKPVIAISRLGDRSAAAALVLREAGFTEVSSLDGGLEAWRRAGY